MSEQQTNQCRALTVDWKRTEDVWYRACYPIEWTNICVSEFQRAEHIRRDLNGFCGAKMDALPWSKQKGWRGDLMAPAVMRQR